MSMSKCTFFAVCFLCLAFSANNVLAERGWMAREAVETEGWHVAYGNELTGRDARRGYVEPGVSLYDRSSRRDRRAIRAWADSLVLQALALMVNREGVDSAMYFRHKEQRDARRFFLDTVRELLRSRASGAQILDAGAVEVKAGVVEYGRRRQVLIPYVGLRPKYMPRRRWHRDDNRWERRERYRNDGWY